MKLNRLGPRKYLFYWFWTVFIISLVLYNEFFVYYLNTLNWLKLRCENEKECTRMLLVADPQIIGEYSEARIITPFSIFDSDSYLKKTYNYALDFSKPDLIIFLGDLMDEGERATDKEFHNYVRRVYQLFLYGPSSSIRHIWLPGDNDIGGEEFDVRPRQLQRFERAFSQPDLITHKNLTFFKVNRMTLSIPVYKKHREFYDTSNIFIGLSHLPLMFMPTNFVDKVIKKMLPQLIFTAHEHKCMIISTDALLRTDYHIIPVTPETNQIFEYTLGVTDMYEILVPTCSYRMGTLKIGYGYAILEKNQLRFTVLWSHSRFHQLLIYLIVLICFTISFCVRRCCYRSSRL